MSPVEYLVPTLTKGLTSALLKAAGRHLRRRLQEPERQEALGRCCQAGIVALVAAAGRTATDDERQLLDDIFRSFFTGEETRADVATEIAMLLRGQPLNHDELDELFADAGFDAETLPGVDFGRALNEFQGAFLTAAVEESTLRGEIQFGVLVNQLTVQREIHAELRKLVTFLAGARPETIEIGSRQIEARTAADGTVVHLELPRAAAPSPLTPLQPYLERLMNQAGQLTLSGVDPAVASRDDAALELDAVYTALLTHGGVEELSGVATGEEREPRAVAALEQLNRYQRLVLLGDPGSGKSTFVNFLAMCMAGALTGSERVGLGLLTAPLPDDQGEDGEENQPWAHGALLPVRIILRDFAARGLPDSSETPGTAEHLWKFVVDELDRARQGELAGPLEEALKTHGGLVLLDGLDEVPEADGRREQILSAVNDFAETFHRCRFVVTCRTYAYRQRHWRLTKFGTAVLLPLSQGQIRRFIDRWYQHIALLRHLDLDDARGRAALLESAVFGSERLLDLAKRPLLLTLMASLHAWREGSLPERREELYADAVKLLLDFWERKRVVLDPDGKPVVQQPGLAEWLKVDREAVRRLLDELAFRAHGQQPELVGTADVSQGDLVTGLLEIADNPDAKPGRLLEYLCDRAGLLLERGEKVYTFPHRTFQEYLAACHLTATDFPDQVSELARADPERWREVALLAGAKAGQGTPAAAWQLAEALCFREPADGNRNQEDAHGAHLAGLLLLESADLERVAERHRPKLERVRRWQLDLLRGSELASRDRAACGRSLARLGETRDAVLTVGGKEFCLVPPGPFEMGEGAGIDQVDVPGFWLGRYPVTRAQYDSFVKSDGYLDDRWWSEAQSAGVWQDGALQFGGGGALEGPREFPSVFSLANHPVVGVSWYEACAFCCWVTQRLHEQGHLASDWEVRLPREAEWEKAARGGLEIPSASMIRSLSEGLDGVASPGLVTNDLPRRRYPWGEEINVERANYSQTAIGSTSAVGCFSSGVSPYGCEEMSGNVWEWCEDEEEVPWARDEPGRVLRGGSWDYSAENLRAAIRGRDRASYRSVDFGFRVLAAPASLVS